MIFPLIISKGIFLDFVYQKDEGAKYSIFPTCKLYQEFEPLPNPSIIEVIIKYFNKVNESQVQHEKLNSMKRLHNLVRSLSLSLQMESYFSNRKRYKPQFTSLLHKFLIPERNAQDFGLWKLVCMGEELCKGIDRNFASVNEIKHSLLFERYDPFEFFAEEILEYVLEIVESSMLEITLPNEETSLDVNLIIPEYYYAGRKLNDHFLKKCLDFTWIDNYINVYLWRDYFLCLRAFFNVEENVNEGLLIKIFNKFEELIRLSVEEKFLNIIRESSEPEALIKKHRYLLNLLKGEFRIILAKDDLDTSPFNNLFNQIATSSLLDFFLGLDLNVKRDPVSDSIMENCTHTFIFLHSLAQITYPEIDKITFYAEITVKNISKLTMDYVQDRYKFYELSCFFFQVLKDIELLPKTFTLIPEHYDKLISNILPDVNIHQNQLAHFFDPLIGHIFTVLNTGNYATPEEAKQCVSYLKKYLIYSRNITQEIRKEFEEHNFNFSETVTSPKSEESMDITEDKDNVDRKLINQSFLCKIKSKIICFGKIFREALSYIEIIVFNLKEDEIKEICEIINDIFHNPILLYVEWSCLSRFLDTLKKVCVNNDVFQKHTIDKICQCFFEVTENIEDVIKNNPRTSESVQRVKGLINHHRDFWDYYKENEVEIMNSLGYKTLFSIIKLDTLALFFDYFSDNNVKFSPNYQKVFLNTYESILQLCVQLEVNFKADLLHGLGEVDIVKNSDLSSLDTMNLYMRVVVLYLFPPLISSPAPIPQDIMQKLSQFILDNLNFKNHTKAQIKNDPSKLIHQIHIFSVFLAHFPIEQTGKYPSFRIFVGMDNFLQTVLGWVRELLKKFDRISDCKWQVISKLENLLSKFVKQLHLSLHDLYKTEVNDPLKSLDAVKKIEMNYYKYLCEMIQTDFPYYENFSSKDTLYKIFNNFHQLVETMCHYKHYHEKVANTKKRRIKRVRGRPKKKPEKGKFFI